MTALSALAADVPYLTGRVVDNAEILQPATRDRLTALLKAHESETTNQIAVLTVPTIGGESIEQYATEVFEHWKLGQKDKDNGVPIVVVPQDRKMRIEVGYGLEGTLTDVAASRIIRNVMTPQFKAGNYDQGIADGVAAVLAQLEGRDAPVSSDATPATSESKSAFQFEGPDMPWPMRILMGAFIFGIIGLFTIIGVMTPGFGWFLYLFLIPFWAMFPLIIIGQNATLAVFLTYIVGYPIAKLVLSRTGWYAKAAADLKTKGHASIGGFTMSSSGGSSRSSSSSSSEGGFSGGGGSSGGGGASGSW
jgi:uncharacterized protein